MSLLSFLSSPVALVVCFLGLSLIDLVSTPVHALSSRLCVRLSSFSVRFSLSFQCFLVLLGGWGGQSTDHENNSIWHAREQQLLMKSEETVGVEACIVLEWLSGMDVQNHSRRHLCLRCGCWSFL